MDTSLEQCSSSSSQAEPKPAGHHGFESDSSLSTSIEDSSSDYRSQIELCQTIQTWPSLESPNPMRLRASKSKQSPANKNKIKNKNSSSSNNISNREKNSVGCRSQVCSCAASFTADCAAICCCPCAILHLLILAFVKVPASFARKALCYARKKAVLRKRPADHKDDHDDEDHRGRYSFSPWSYTDSPATSTGSPAPPKFDTQKLWAELYEAGHMGFGGPPFHWNNHDHGDQLEDACFHSSKADSLPRLSNA